MTGGLFEEPAAKLEDFFGGEDPNAPLADRMRPRSLEEFVGQTQLVAEGKLLRRVLDGEHIQSLILWGPPGTGKTTLARLIAAKSGMRFVPFSAVLSGIKEIRAVMAEAESARRRNGARTLLFVDEIHRFNKAQQDAFLPYVERGDILLIGATTENPSFEINGALLSRVRVLVLEQLTIADLVQLLRHALESDRGFEGSHTASDEALTRIAHASDGDARRALVALETAAAIVDVGGEIRPEDVAEALQRKLALYDKSGEEHFNLASALHKSIRNSDSNATLYWLTRMMEAGEDGKYIGRRLIRMASEDIGLADPFALRIALDAADAFHRLGYPEGKLALAQAAVYLARTRKSNALYVALDRAQRDVQESSAEPVPLHLRNASTRLMEDVGYGKGYRYAHDDPDAVNEMQCMPPSLAGRKYFKQPTEQGGEGRKPSNS